MKSVSLKLIIGLIIFTVIFNFACDQEENVESEMNNTPVLNVENETAALLDFFEKTGNYINSESVPPLVLSEEVHDYLKEYKLIDIRTREEYKNGHIENATNIQPKNIIDYLKFDISPVSYNKIVIICNTGLESSFVATVLRFLGYGNVYAMKYGMSSWNKTFADKYWYDNTSSAYVSQLVTEDYTKPDKGEYPKINTRKKTAYEILEARAEQILDSVVFKINANSLFADLSGFYIVNYWPKFQYEKGHIPGAFQYTPRESLTRDSALFTLPENRAVVIYDYTGHHSASVAAYLQLLGYNAYALEYGTNAIMYNQLIPKKIGRVFNSDAVNNYEILEGISATKEEKEKSDSI